MEFWLAFLDDNLLKHSFDHLQLQRAEFSAQSNFIFLESTRVVLRLSGRWGQSDYTKFASTAPMSLYYHWVEKYCQNKTLKRGNRQCFCEREDGRQLKTSRFEKAKKETSNRRNKTKSQLKERGAEKVLEAEDVSGRYCRTRCTHYCTKGSAGSSVAEGISTLSMTWIIPFEFIKSLLKTDASLTCFIQMFLRNVECVITD